MSINTIARNLAEDDTRDEVEEKIARGLAQAERGEVIDGEEAFRQLRDYSARREREAEKISSAGIVLNRSLSELELTFT